jgi:hypothetical protein
MVHTIIHRGLTPQTVTHAWLVLTLALTFALAIAHAAIMQGSALVVGDALRGAGPVVAHAVPSPHAQPSTLAAPAAVADTVERDDATTCTQSDEPVARPAGAGAPASTIIPAAPARSRGASALAELYGGAGPHGPPAAKGSR